jgi:hypothetical protein
MPTEPFLKMLPGMMPILHSSGVRTPGQFGPIRRDLEPVERALDLDHVGTGMPSVMQTISGISASIASRSRRGAGRRHIDHRRVGAGLSRPSATVSKTGRLSRCTGRSSPPLPGDAADHLGAVGDRLLGVEGAVLAGEALADDLGVLVDQDGHGFDLLRLPDGLDDLLGGVVEVVGRNDVEAGFVDDLLAELDVGAFEAHDQRNLRPTSLTAATTPSAMTSHFMMPPKMLTRMPFTFGSAVMILNAAVTFSLVGAAADVEEVRGLGAVELDDVHGRHGQAGAVDHAADVAVERDVGEVVLGGLDLLGVFLGLVAQRDDVFGWRKSALPSNDTLASRRAAGRRP